MDQLWSKKKKPVLFAVGFLLLCLGYYIFSSRHPDALVITGIVTTDDIAVSSRIAGQIEKVLVREGASVKKGQLLAVISPVELDAEAKFFGETAEARVSEISESQAAVQFEKQRAISELKRAKSALAASIAQIRGAAADFEKAKIAHDRAENLARAQQIAAQDLDRTRTDLRVAQAALEWSQENQNSHLAAVELAKSQANQVVQRESQLRRSKHLAAGAQAQRQQANTRLGYTQLRAPIDGVVDVGVVRAGENVVPGETVVTLLNPDDLWVSANVEETYIEQVRIGDRVTIRLPSGVERSGQVILRSPRGAYATQRDVSRVRRDIRTFEIRIRVDNSDRSLAVGMSAYVVLRI